MENQTNINDDLKGKKLKSVDTYEDMKTRENNHLNYF